MITTRHLIDLIWAAKDYEEAERAVAQYEADIRADQARRDAEIGRNGHINRNSCADVAREIERSAGIGKEKSDETAV